LIRTPVEAGEHIKHYWDEFRAGLKATLGDIASQIAQLAFIKPVTGTIAGALGFGQAGQQLGSFGGVNPSLGISGSQIALNVSGLSSGSGIFNATQGGYVFQSGNNLNLQGTPQTASGGGGAPAVSGNAGLSDQQFQTLLNAAIIAPGTATQTSAAPSEAFLGAVTSASAAAQPVSSATSTAEQSGAASSNVILLPGPGATPLVGSFAAQPPALPEVAAAVTGQASTPAKPATTAATSGLGSISNIGQIAGLIEKLNSNLPGFLPDFLSSGGSGGAGGLFGNVGNFFSNLGGNLGFATEVPATSADLAATLPSNLLTAEGLPQAGITGTIAQSGLFGTTATFGSFLAGAGAGFGAGSLLNSLLGGNAVGGNIGSAAGGAIGSAVGSFLLPGIGTLLGGLLGGSGLGILGGSLAARRPGKARAPLSARADRSAPIRSAAAPRTSSNLSKSPIKSAASCAP
jgi:hypothetical protein